MTVTVVGISVSLGFDLSPVMAAVATLKISNITPTPTICPYCAVGCGALTYVDGAGVLVDIEGDPDHPISGGSLCSKGSSLYQVATSTRRLTTPLYRAAGSSTWVAKDWAWTLNTIAARVKSTRDANFIATDPLTGVTANRTEAIACLGGAALDNEEAYILAKLMRSLGVVYLEHQARI